MNIEVGKTYIGGRNGDERHVLREGAKDGYIIWGHPRDLLPLGGHHGPTRVTSVKSFQVWATAVKV